MTDPDRTLTRPWAADEYIRVNGYTLAYAAERKQGISVVYLYGGITATLDELRAAGHDVVMPKHVRWGG
jgi:hypothetical protein